MKEDEYKKSMLTLRMTMPAAGTLAAKRSEMPSSGWMWRVRAFGSTSRIAWRPNVRWGGRLNCTRIVVERFGIRFVASPRHADVLMVTGPVTKNMREALERTYHAVPNPKWVVAIGDCARDGGCFAGSYAVVGGVSEVVPVDLHIAGCPPTPTAMLRGLLALLERVDTGAVAP